MGGMVEKEKEEEEEEEKEEEILSHFGDLESNNNNNNNDNNNDNGSNKSKDIVKIESNMIRVKSSNAIHNNNNNEINKKSTNSGENSPSKNKNRLMSPILTENFPFSKSPFSPTSTSFSTSLNFTLPKNQNTTSSLPIEWPTSPSHSVMACFSHSSSLDAFIISAVLPVWNHALVRTVRAVCVLVLSLS
jgi:hypothetical protein